MNASAEAQNQLLKEAKAAGTGSDESCRKVLSFAIAGDSYAIPIDLIKEILEYGSVTRVPMAPDHIRGVLNLRGAVVPVIDLAARLGRPRAAVSKRTCIVILAIPDEEGTVDMGVVVDSVNEVLDIPEGDIEPTPSFGTNVPPELIEGIGKVRGRFVVILDAASTFDVEALSAVGGAVGRRVA